MTFSVELAGVPVRIHCEFEQNVLFFRDYWTDREPEAEVIPDEETLERIRLAHAQAMEKEGARFTPMTAQDLERNALHALIAEKLIPHDVLLAHGSALCMEGEAYLFTARSGTGKSTQARLWREVFGDRVWMINDDKPFLQVLPDQILVYGSPWDGKHHLSRNASAPLRAVMEVYRAEQNCLEPMNTGDAFQTLITHAYLPRESMDRIRAVQMGKTIAEKVPFYRLHCNMEMEAARVTWAGLQHDTKRDM